MALANLPPVIKYGVQKRQVEATGEKWYVAMLGAKQWKTLMAPLPDVTIVNKGVNHRPLKKKHRRRRDAAPYGPAVIARYRRLLKAMQ